MLERAKGQFTIEGNVEEIFGGISGATRIARISQTCLFTGQLEGESIGEYTAVLPREGDRSFQGFQRISGTLGEREGTFVVQVSGDYVKGQPRGSWTIVPKSGSGDFLHIRGGGSFTQSAGKTGSYTVEFDLRKPRKARDAAVSRDELVPGIDIVADEEIDVAPVAPEPVTESPKRRRKMQPEAIVAEASPIPTTEVRPKRARTAPPPAEKAIEVEPITKPKRTRTKVEVVSEQAEPTSEATDRPAKSPRTRSKTGASEPAPIPAPKPTPTRRKKSTVPPAPVALPVAQNKPARQRKANAA